MAFNTLKHRNVSQIDWMFERGIGFVAGFTLAIREATEIYRMLYSYGFEDGCWPR